MSTDVTLPQLGESVTEGTVSRWLKQVGDQVEADEPLLEISTDKVDTEIPSPAAGVLLEIKASEDETVEVGAVLAVIGDEGESADSAGDEQAASSDQGDSDEGDSDQGDSGAGEDKEQAQQQAAKEPSTQESAPVAESGSEEDDEQQSAAGKETRSSGDSQGTEVTLPQLGESVTEGTVSRWLKSVGDTIEEDEALVEISTDKVDTEIPSPAAGTLLEIRVGEDETVEVGAVLAVVGEKDAQSGPADSGAGSEGQAGTSDAGAVEEVEDQAGAGDEGGQQPIPAPEPEPKQEEPKKEEPKPEPKQEEPTPDQAAGGDSDKGYVTPLVRKLAAEHDVDLASLSGTGVGGRIRKQDVLAAAEAKKAPAAAEAPAAAVPPAQAAPAAQVEASSLRGTTEKMSRLRKTIASRMVESLQVSAQLTTVVEVDLTNVSRLRARAKEDFARNEGVKLSYLPFLVKAAIEALKVHPKVNATIDTEAGTITYPSAENVSIAVDTDKGLLAPVIKDAGDLNLAGIARKIADLADRSRTNKLGPDDLAGGTFTVTNTGSRGALFDTPIINQPQVGILGTGAIVKRPVVLTDKVLGETIAVRDMMYLALSYDHRLVDGADAARFLATVKARLEEGNFATELGL